MDALRRLLALLWGGLHRGCQAHANLIGRFQFRCFAHYCPECGAVMQQEIWEATGEAWRRCPSCGYLAREAKCTRTLLWETGASNGVVTVGKNYLLDAGFHGSAASSTWYIGLIRDDNYSALAAGDTMASHAGWEEGDEYTGDRKEWTEGAAAAGSMTNASSVDFSINDTETFKGAFLCDGATGTACTLYCTALFDEGDRPCASGYTLQATYTISLS